MKRSLLIASLALLFVTACVGPSAGERGRATRDSIDFATHVQPILEASCATLDCHGNSGRPLRLYAETGLRIRDDIRNQTITQEELDANVASILGLDTDAESWESDLILLKPLAVRAGGVFHVGGDIWPSTQSDAYICMHGWLLNQIADSSVTDACARAYEAVKLPDA